MNFSYEQMCVYSQSRKTAGQVLKQCSERAALRVEKSAKFFTKEKQRAPNKGHQARSPEQP